MNAVCFAALGWQGVYSGSSALLHQRITPQSATGSALVVEVWDCCRDSCMGYMCVLVDRWSPPGRRAGQGRVGTVVGVSMAWQ
jgi:hypothetical protein